MYPINNQIKSKKSFLRYYFINSFAIIFYFTLSYIVYKILILDNNIDNKVRLCL